MACEREREREEGGRERVQVEGEEKRVCEEGRGRRKVVWKNLGESD